MNEGFYYCKISELENHTLLERSMTEKALKIVYDNTKNVEIFGLNNLHAVIIKLKSFPTCSYDCVNYKIINIEV